MKQKNIKRALFAYYCGAACLWTYLITTSLWFSYEHFIGNLPAGMVWIFGVIGLAFALRFFFAKMMRLDARVDNFLFINNKDIMAVLCIVLVAIIILAALAYSWLKLYPTLF